MSKSIRFLGLAIFAWAGVRAVSLGVVPGAEALAFDTMSARRSSPLPPIELTMLPQIEPIVAAQGPEWAGMTAAVSPQFHPMQAPPGYAPYPVYVPVNAAAARSAPPQVIYVNPPYGEFREGQGRRDELAATDAPPALAFKPAIQSTPSFETPKGLPSLRRLAATGWAMLRNQGGPDSLAGRGMLGGSEAGARLMWNFTPRLAATLRSSAPVNSQRGAEAALGVRYLPLQSVPVTVTLERRHAIKEYGRSAFAIFAEGGVYGRPLPWQTTIDGYFQAGVVDFKNPDWFVDGQIAISRPIWRNISGGLGAWGGAQPNLNRIDVGPRISMQIGKRMRAHIDYRLNIAGTAEPGSGAVVTLAGDF